MMIRQILITLALLFATVESLTLTAQSSMRPAGPWVFAYFHEPADQGIYLALSRDGYTFTPLNDGQPWLKPDVPDELMRDVYITRTPDGHHFRMVFTWAWHGNAIGVSDSDDLMHWSPQRKVEIMSAFPNVQNTWAPEAYWDKQHKDWVILFSASFNPDPSTHTPGDGLRIWSSRTTDWQKFSKPEKFFDRGFPVIDATLFHRTLNNKHDVVMVLKDQTVDPLRYNERWTTAPTVSGPWGKLSGPINESWSEGPSVIQVGNRAIVYYDHYRPPHPRYEGVETTDWIHWSSVDDKMHFPNGAKHGSFFQVTEVEAQRLLARHDLSK